MKHLIGETEQKMSEKELNNETEVVVGDQNTDKTVDKKTEAKKPKEKKPGFFAKVKQGWKNYIGEMKKITWPTFKQTTNNTIVVIISMIVVGIFVASLDVVFQNVIKLLAKIG